MVTIIKDDMNKLHTHTHTHTHTQVNSKNIRDNCALNQIGKSIYKIEE